jgi:hypothetical protein
MGIYDGLVCPDDELSTLLQNEILLWGDKLPYIFRTNVPLYEINYNVQGTIRMKHITWWGLYDGKYHDKFSRSDIQYAKRIKFWVKFPPLVQFKDSCIVGDEGGEGEEGLTWVLRNHRVILLHVLEHHRMSNNSLWTLHGDIKCLTRLMKLFDLSFLQSGSDVVKGCGIYMKYCNIGECLNNHLVGEEEFNIISDIELNKMIDWEMILTLRDKLEQDWNNISRKNTIEAYDCNLNLVLLSIYTLAYPLRKEIMTLTIINDMALDNKKDDFLHLQTGVAFGTFVLNKAKKKHYTIHIRLNKKLTKLLKESIHFYPRKYLFTHKRNMTKAVSCETVSKRLSLMFSHLGKNVGVSSLRSSFVSWLYRSNASTAFKKQCALNMRTSMYAFDTFYRKISMSPELKKQIIKKEDDIDDITVNCFDEEGRIFIWDNEECGDCDISEMDPLIFGESGLLQSFRDFHIEDGGDRLGNWNKMKEKYEGDISIPVSIKIQSNYHKEYYKKNKAHICLLQKEWYVLNKETRYLKSILKRLNNDQDYLSRVKESTLEKWEIWFCLKTNMFVSELLASC